MLHQYKGDPLRGGQTYWNSARRRMTILTTVNGSHRTNPRKQGALRKPQVNGTTAQSKGLLDENMRDNRW